MAERSVPDQEAMLALGAELAAIARPPLIVTLSGPLGAGKTTLVRGWLHALGHQGAVRSPTYTLVESHELAGMAVHHVDLYRLADGSEIEFLGLRELQTADAIWLVEWPERAAGMLPPIDWALAIAWAGEGRRVSGLPAATG